MYSVNQNELSISQVRHDTSAGDNNVKRTGPCPPSGAQWKKQAWQQVREVRPCSLSGAWLTLAEAVGDAQADWVREHTPPGRGISVNRGTEGLEHWGTLAPQRLSLAEAERKGHSQGARRQLILEGPRVLC